LKRTLAGEAIGDICQMTKRAGQVAFENVRREFFAFPAANAIDEIAEISAGGDMVIDLGERLALLVALWKEPALFHDALLEVEFVGDLERKVPIDLGNFRIRDQAARFEQQQGLAVVEDRNELVGRFALDLEVRFINVPAAQANDAMRQRSAQRPAGN